MDFQELFNGAMAVILLLAGFILNSLRCRIEKVEGNQIPKELCEANHKLDEEKIGNLIKQASMAERRNMDDHKDLKIQLGDVYKILGAIQKCVYNLAGQTSKNGEKIDEG